MTASMSGVILFLIAAASILALIWRMSKPEPEDPPGVKIRRNSYWGWNYTLQDTRGMLGTGYLTRASAIRAAQAELNRLNTKDQQTQ